MSNFVESFCLRVSNRRVVLRASGMWKWDGTSRKTREVKLQHGTLTNLIVLRSSNPCYQAKKVGSALVGLIVFECQQRTRALGTRKWGLISRRPRTKVSNWCTYLARLSYGIGEV